jgi:hypothetical protein
MPGDRCARSLACEKQKHTSKYTTDHTGTSGIPRAIVLAVSFVLSSVIGLFVTVAGAMRVHRRQFGISVEMPGPHDFAVRECDRSSCDTPRPSHPAPRP